MATVTGFTAERTQEIENRSIVTAAVVGNNLILTRFDGTTINAGNVRGAQGEQGPVGQVSTSDLAAAVASMQEEVSTTGLGLIAIAERALDQTIAGFSSGIWHDVTGSTVTFTPIVGRYYSFTAQCARQSEGANTEFDLRIVRVGGGTVAAGYAFVPTADKTVPLNATRTMAAEGDWGGSQSFKLQTRHNTAFQSYVKGTGYVTSLTVADEGKP